ncbi:hypothetical protein B0A48_02468 [Cryoendolithus antarcticus]|uniref:C2H2-type domain-containing protein n=1 Tax=Cryoendolithus antarcticus TaxID=1507870 RepID=A0A1V8TNW7_9PEZI|nr:hypothetical protein B0A48_02468 [Cryoendolithus antarcticus]
MNRLDITFADGLQQYSDSVTPPSLDFVMSLPLYVRIKLWAIYLHVLQRSGGETLVYIGSATNAKYGTWSRLESYRKGEALPQYVKQAMDQGYTITHTTLLAYCKIPSAGNVACGRAVFVAMEAAFSAIFWSMRRRDRSYGLAASCPWPREAYEWGGLCGHSPLDEGIHGDLELSPEELEEVAKTVRANQNARSKVKMAANRQKPEWQARDTELRKQRAPALKSTREERKASQKFWCTTCNIPCRDSTDLAKHNKKRRHLKKLKGLMGTYVCKPCAFSHDSRQKWDKHCTTPKHERNIAAAAQ